MRIATAEDIAVLELLAVEVQLSGAVSIARPSVVPRERKRPVVLPQRAIRRDRPLVGDDTARARLGEPGLFGFPIGSRWQADLEVGAREELAGR